MINPQGDKSTYVRYHIRYTHTHMCTLHILLVRVQSVEQACVRNTVYDYAYWHPKTFSELFFLRKLALRHWFWLSLSELIDLTKSVVPDVKDPFKQRSESLAIFFWGGTLSLLRYSYISSKKHIFLEDDNCTSFNKRYVENSEADTNILPDNDLLYLIKSFATDARWIRDHHAELSTQRNIVVFDIFFSDVHPNRVKISQEIPVNHLRMTCIFLSLKSLATARYW